ncbi:MAG TPA: twin-arginine translocase TatA/TatE family subunit [Geopsychrobacteraceae bacterium]|nr:twin-arginine translocase TatA/TatE family subunit [Geopsychrobacteraceae bacterium]
MFGFGGTELMIILGLVLIVFGAGKLPKIGASLGRSVRSFKEGIADGEAIEVPPSAEASVPDKE